MLTEADPKDYTLDSAGIGRRIRNARIEKHKTQEDVGAHCGCTSVHICNVENGKNSVSLELLWKICLYLDISMDSVMMDQDIMRPRIMLDSDILPKLEKCDTPTLTVVNGFIDYLLVVKDEYITKYAIEASATHDAKPRYEHKIVFVDKQQKY